MKVAKDLLHIFRVLVIDFKIFKQQDAESLGTFVTILLAVQMPSDAFFLPCLDLQTRLKSPFSDANQNQIHAGSVPLGIFP